MKTKTPFIFSLTINICMIYIDEPPPEGVYYLQKRSIIQATTISKGRKWFQCRIVDIIEPMIVRISHASSGSSIWEKQYARRVLLLAGNANCHVQTFDLDLQDVTKNNWLFRHFYQLVQELQNRTGEAVEITVFASNFDSSMAKFVNEYLINDGKWFLNLEPYTPLQTLDNIDIDVGIALDEFN